MNRFIRHIAILILSLPILLVGCTVLDEDTPVGESSSNTCIAVNVRSLLTNGTPGGGKPVVNSIRLLVFSIDEGECIGNQKFDNSSTDITMQLTCNVRNKRIDVYAILNEDGYCTNLSGGMGALSAALGGKLDRNSFLALINAPLSFDVVGADTSNSEPAFLMYADRLNLLVNVMATQDKPLSVELSAAVPRSMAKITFTGIEGIASSEVASVFVTDLRIVNVPENYSLSGESVGSPFGSIAIGEANKEGYYDRNWDGRFSGNYSITVTQSMDINDRCWRALDGDKDNSWSFDSYFTYENKKSSDIESLVLSKYKFKSGNLPSLRASLQDKAENMAENTPLLSTISKQISPSGSQWDISSNKSVYVPENIPVDRKSATAIAVTLVIATPRIDVTEEAITEKVDISKSNFTFVVSANGKTIPEWTNSDREVEELFKGALNYCWSSDHSVVNEPVYADRGNYLLFVEGFEATRSATSSAISYSGKPGETLDGVTSSWALTSTIATFVIPITEDYSIVRNNHYQIGLQVDGNTYKSLKAASSSANTRMEAVTADKCPVKVSVKVSPLQ